MTEKIDLAIWAKNGGWCLSPVLSRIQEVIPPKKVCCKILIDDGSTDDTADIGRKHGWTVISTKGVGIGRAAQLALDHVDTNFFCSFEQDVLLHPKWFETLYPQIKKNTDTAVIQGARLSSLKPMRIMEKWRWRRNPYLVSIDNNIYRSDIIRRIGGFPNNPFAGVDTLLHNKLKKAGWNWVVDKSIVSLHLRRSLLNDILRLYRYQLYNQGKVWRKKSLSISTYALKFLASPVRGWMIAIEFAYLPVAVIYPLIRFFSYKGYIDAMKLLSRK
ncbi:MAG: glycosyltransferase [Candidatus Ranarchaeia archaeon]